jgi:predicted exporter
VKPSRLAIVGGWLVALGASAAWLTWHFSVNTELSVFLPPSTTPEQRLLVGQLRRGLASRLVLISVEGAKAPELARVSMDLARRLRNSDLFSFVSNGDPSGLQVEHDILLRHRYLLSPAVRPERFSTKGLEAGLAGSLEALASPLAAVFRATIPLDPTGEMRELIRLIAPQSGPLVRYDVWFSRDGSRALLLAETRAPGFDVEAQRRSIAAIEKAFTAASSGNARIELSGPGVFAARVHDTIRAESWVLSVIAAALVATILAVAYRSATITAACALPVMAGILVGITTVVAAFGSVHAITLAFGATLIGEAVDYPSYLFINARPGESLVRTVERIGPTLWVAVLTTIFGALTMALSSFEGLAQLGLLTISGVIAAGITTMYVLPSMAPEYLMPRKPNAVQLPAIPRKVLGIAWWPIVALTMAALAFLVIMHERLWEDDLAKLSPISESSKAADRKLRAELGAPDVRYLLIARGADGEGALQNSESLAAWLQEQVAAGQIDGFELPSHYLPSRRTQEIRRAALPDAKILAENLKAALRTSPFREDAFMPFLAAVERTRSGPLLEAENLRGSMFGLKVSALLVETEDGWFALAPLRGVKAPQKFASEAAHAGYPLFDLKEETNRLVNQYRTESLRLFVLGLCCIAALLVLSLRSVARAVRVFFPIAAAAVLDLALLLLLGRTLSLFNLVALLLVIGVGLNYALFFERPQADNADRARTQLSVAVCAATTLSVFGCLMLSETPVLKSIGETVFFGCLLSLLLSTALAGRPGGSTA